MYICTYNYVPCVDVGNVWRLYQEFSSCQHAPLSIYLSIYLYIYLYIYIYICMHVCVCNLYFIVPWGKLGSPYLGKAQQPREQRYPLLPVCAVFSCLQTMPVFGIFNPRTGVDACDCTRELYGHRERVCTESWLWEKNPLPYRGLEPASVYLYIGSLNERVPPVSTLSVNFGTRSCRR